MRNILDIAADGIITLDGDGKICSLNASAQNLFGYRPADIIGQPFLKLFKGSARKILSQYLEELNTVGLASVFNDGREVTAKVAQGGAVSLFVTIGKLETPAGRDGKGSGGALYCAVVRDITSWKQTEAQLRNARQDAEEQNARKSLFLANISHELRTPLNAIMGFSEVMLSERFGEIGNEKYLAYANDIHTSGGFLLSLINDLLDLAKIDAGKLELDFTNVNLLNVIDEAINSLQNQAAGQRVLLRKDVSPGLPGIVADARSIKQILLNLLSNAVKFTDSGGQVIVSAGLEKGGSLRLAVKDTGRGMNKKQLARALEPFQQIDPDKDSDAPGTGLGLPLTKALAEANRAAFSISSTPKKGTLVEIVFPTTRVLAG